MRWRSRTSLPDRPLNSSLSGHATYTAQCAFGLTCIPSLCQPSPNLPHVVAADRLVTACLRGDLLSAAAAVADGASVNGKGVLSTQQVRLPGSHTTTSPLGGSCLLSCPARAVENVRGSVHHHSDCPLVLSICVNVPVQRLQCLRTASRRRVLACCCLRAGCVPALAVPCLPPDACCPTQNGPVVDSLVRGWPRARA